MSSWRYQINKKISSSCISSLRKRERSNINISNNSRYLDTPGLFTLTTKYNSISSQRMQGFEHSKEMLSNEYTVLCCCKIYVSEGQNNNYLDELTQKVEHITAKYQNQNESELANQQLQQRQQPQKQQQQQKEQQQEEEEEQQKQQKQQEPQKPQDQIKNENLGSSKFHKRNKLIQVFADPTYNRTCYTIAGMPKYIKEVAVCIVADAFSKLNLTSHEATHPRIGLVDHISIHPLIGKISSSTFGSTSDEDGNGHDNVNRGNLKLNLNQRTQNQKLEYLSQFQDCNLDHLYDDFVNKLGQELAFILHEQHHAPILCYGKLNNIRLADIRKRMSYFDSHLRDKENDQREEGENKEIDTDLFGKMSIHPDIGVICIGTTPFILNYNVRLNTAIKGEASKITKRVREKDGGLPSVEALTLQHENGHMEVACNLLNPQEIGPRQVLKKIHSLLQEQNMSKKEETKSSSSLEIESAYVTGLTEDQILNKLFPQ